MTSNRGSCCGCVVTAISDCQGFSAATGWVKKANLDVEIAVDMMALVGSYDTAVLSGDGDLAG